LLSFSGILERHPRLRVVFTEGGIAWVPSALFDADRTYLSFESEMRPKLAHPPSYYWFQNCYATFMEDPPGIEQLHRIGWDRVMWSGDYGHPESTIGYTRAAVRELFNQVGDGESARAIVGGAATALWDLR
jgi:predicted TIM-barrel fold metal-dependent hydrolase